MAAPRLAAVSTYFKSRPSSRARRSISSISIDRGATRAGRGTCSMTGVSPLRWTASLRWDGHFFHERLRARTVPRQARSGASHHAAPRMSGSDMKGSGARARRSAIGTVWYRTPMPMRSSSSSTRRHAARGRRDYVYGRLRRLGPITDFAGVLETRDNFLGKRHRVASDRRRRLRFLPEQPAFFFRSLCRAAVRNCGIVIVCRCEAPSSDRRCAISVSSSLGESSALKRMRSGMRRAISSTASIVESTMTSSAPTRLAKMWRRTSACTSSGCNDEDGAHISFSASA